MGRQQIVLKITLFGHVFPLCTYMEYIPLATAHWFHTQITCSKLGYYSSVTIPIIRESQNKDTIYRWLISLLAFPCTSTAFGQLCASKFIVFSNINVYEHFHIEYCSMYTVSELFCLTWILLTTHFLCIVSCLVVLLLSVFLMAIEWPTIQGCQKCHPKRTNAYSHGNYSRAGIIWLVNRSRRSMNITAQEYDWRNACFHLDLIYVGHAETAHNRIASVVLGFKEALLEEAEKKKDKQKWV